MTNICTLCLATLTKCWLDQKNLKKKNMNHGWIHISSGLPVAMRIILVYLDCDNIIIVIVQRHSFTYFFFRRKKNSEFVKFFNLESRAIVPIRILEALSQSAVWGHTLYLSWSLLKQDFFCKWINVEMKTDQSILFANYPGYKYLTKWGEIQLSNISLSFSC